MDLIYVLAIAAFLLALMYRRFPLLGWTALAATGLAVLYVAPVVSTFTYSLLCLLFVPSAVVLNVPSLRQKFLSAPVFKWFKKQLPPLSDTEREALEAGEAWWDADLFQGHPNWQKLVSLPKPALTAEEQNFIDNQVNTLCAMLDDWSITHELYDLPEEVWSYLKSERFFSLIIPKEFGGLEFSALANSEIVSKIASRSMSCAVTVMVPNSLGPGELLMHYGTEAQKQYYLPRLASGEEVPCFGLTGPDAGCDATSIADKAIVCRGMHEGKEVLGAKLTFEKRYITLAPIATLISLAVKLYDPDGLLGDEPSLGITVFMLPNTHPGIKVGKRHLPSGLSFMNGPIRGEEVFVPLDWIIGGQERAGQGWRMLVECLSAGRGISLPALSTAISKMAYRTTGAYAKIRRQFRVPIGAFEGVQELMARVGGYTYILEACRRLTVQGIDLGYKPSVVTAIAKYHMTELGRFAVTDAMDIHAGRGVMMGKANYLAHPYQGMPVSITVEGANVLTRNLIIFGQGAVRCHPFVLQEMEAVGMKDEAEGLQKFDHALFAHVGYAVSNFVRTLVMSVTRGKFLTPPRSGWVAPYYKRLTWMSTALSFVSDITMLVLGGALKRKERLSARLGDVLSHLYLASAVLKYYQDQGEQHEHEATARWALDFSLFQIQEAFDGFFRNLPNKGLSVFLRTLVFTWGKPFTYPSDKLGEKVATAMMAPSAFRDTLTEGCYVSDREDDLIGKLDRALSLLIQVEPMLYKFSKFVRKHGYEDGYTFEEQLQEALAEDVLNESEAEALRDYELARQEVVKVDEFEPEYFKRKFEQCETIIKEAI